jgi:CHAT domain
MDHTASPKHPSLTPTISSQSASASFMSGLVPPPSREHFAKPPRVLIIADTTGNLHGAREEGHRLADAIQRSSPYVQLTMLVGSSATRASVKDVRQQSFDVLHYAGHALFDERNPERSGLLMADDTILSPMDITEAAPTSPSLVLLIGSGAARISSDSTANKLSLAEAFL